MVLRWGIAAAGKISNDFVTALKVLPKSEHAVVAVAARSISSAQKFAQKHGIPVHYEGYISLAKDPNVDVVYVGTLNPQHYEVIKMMLEHNKPVLCEKPFTMNEKQTKKILQLAESKKLFVMEAIWSRCFPAYQELRRIIDSGEIGEVKFVSVCLGFELSNVDRLKKKELGGGSTLDLGVYGLQFQQFVYRGLTPTKVVVNGHLNEEGTDDVASAILAYENGKTALVTVNSTVQLPNEAIVVGTKGTIRVPEFWSPTKLEVNGQVKEFPLIENTGTFNFFNSAGLAYEAEEVKKCLQAGKLESDKVPHKETLQLAQLMDTLRKEIGVVFPEDNQCF